ncbi:hypothetical protein PpBr36_02331 [Pyricularia pennisetigena]|uniref:hypothetical protein n=1 Tax=Pyricularia pennisetigena TaxID=1578925 RepID=UPI00114E0F86|nr:hypothetical protein PpBr36_02331 [Pyricularia pennisetigena]TLS31287.1 hypothetical protein PpBr36_02331 [Pyricularia pennisetigena]
MGLLQTIGALYGGRPKLPAPTPEQPRPAFLKLPPEICNEVLARLPQSSQISVSLTCKELYSKYFVTKKDLGGALNVTHNLLQILERDLPGYYLCASCIKLHRWKLQEDGSVQFIGKCDLDPSSAQLQLPSDECVRYTLDLRLVRLVHLYRLYGERYGVPSSYIEKEHRLKLRLGHHCMEECQKVLIHERWEPQFEGGARALLTTYTLTSQDGENEPWKDIIDFLQGYRSEDLYWKEMILMCCEFPLTSVLEKAGFNWDLDSAEEDRDVDSECACYSDPDLEHTRFECGSYTEARKIRDAETGGWQVVITVTRWLPSA